MNSSDVNFFKTTIQRLSELDRVETGNAAIASVGRERWSDRAINWEIVGDASQMENLLREYLRNSSGYYQKMDAPVETEQGPAIQFVIQSP